MISISATVAIAAFWTATAQAPACPHAHHHHYGPAPNVYPIHEGMVPQAGCSLCAPGGRILAPGPGDGWGFQNGNPDGYGWVDYGANLPLGADRTPDYFFRRQFAVLPQQAFLSTYYNPYLQRGQRYIPYAGCGGEHPFGGVPTGNSMTPYTPLQDRIDNPPTPRGEVPVFTGEGVSEPASSGAYDSGASEAQEILNR